MADEKKVNAAPVFFRDGKLVNGKGQEVDKHGQVKEAEGEAAGTSSDAERTRLQGELTDLHAQVAGHATARQEWDAERARLQGELSAAQKAVKDGRLLPEDAEARLVAVPGIGEALAKKALAALTGK